LSRNHLKGKSIPNIINCCSCCKGTSFRLYKCKELLSFLFHATQYIEQCVWRIYSGFKKIIDIHLNNYCFLSYYGTLHFFQMALSPLFRMNDAGDGMTKVRAHRQAQPAMTKYRVLDSSSGCSLVELQPFTGNTGGVLLSQELSTNSCWETKIKERKRYISALLCPQEGSTK